MASISTWRRTGDPSISDDQSVPGHKGIHEGAITGVIIYAVAQIVSFGIKMHKTRW